MSHSQPVSEGESEPESNLPARSQPVDPLRNPSYPQRIHIHERPRWQEVLRRCEDRLGAARQKLSVLGNVPNRAAYERLHAQMLGARDQVADAAARLPGEAGSLYEEDKHRLEEAVAALDRTWDRWETMTKV